MDIGMFLTPEDHEFAYEGSYAEQMGDYSDLIIEDVFIGTYPLDVIIDGISQQFNDYIGTEDTTNYVDIFYDQLHASYEEVKNGEDEDHTQEKYEALDKIKSKFISAIFKMFEVRLTLTIMTIDDESTDEDEVEFVVRRLYEYFILGAKTNFKTVIAKNILSKISGIHDDRQYFDKIYELLGEYDPLIRCITPTEFLRLRGDTEIYNLFENGDVVGNFLRKYSAKLYEHEEFKVELINYITMIQSVKEDIVNAGQ